MRTLMMVVVSVIVGGIVLIGLLGGSSPALAEGPNQEIMEQVGRAELVQPPPPSVDDWYFIALLPEIVVDIEDLSGNVIGEGTHGGAIRCYKGNCSHKMLLQWTAPLVEYEYRFTTAQAIDPVGERVVVSGVGTISSLGQRERFLFSGTFMNNGDGTVSVTYVASRPDASFNIPSSPGAFLISSGP